MFFVIYQQVENHVLQPLVYQPDGRAVAARDPHLVLIGAEVAGVLGALAAIPVAGAIQVLVVDFLRARRERAVETPAIT